MNLQKTDHNSPTGKKNSWSALIWLPLFLFSNACQVQQINSGAPVASNTVVSAEINPGYFLAARQASYLNDVMASARFFLETLEQDKRNPDLLRQSFETQYRNGNIDMAAALAVQLETSSTKAQHAVEPAIAQSIKISDWDAVIVLSDQLAEDVTTAPLAGVIKSWALAASNQGDAGLAHLKKTGQLSPSVNNIIPHYIQIQFALMTEFLGHTDEAIVAATNLAKSSTLPLKIALQTSGILIRNNKDIEAESLLKKLPFSSDQSQINLSQLMAPQDEAAFIANAIIDTAVAYDDPQNIKMVTARLQLALYLDPGNHSAHFFLAQSWFDLNQYSRAKKLLLSIDENSPWTLPALLLQNNIDIKTDNISPAIERFNEYVIHHPDNAYLYKELGDLYRRNKEYEQAKKNYLKAKLRGFDTADLYRNLAIAHERLDEDPEAEVAFKAALHRNPNDPFTLNYLGYWWAESGRNLDQAIRLIEKAVRLRPNSGFFVDSLGWVHFQLGNYQTSVEFLEKATVLEPEDALIISHLGDAYWQTKRYTEARFKWQYAATLANDENLLADLETRITSGLPETK